MATHEITTPLQPAACGPLALDAFAFGGADPLIALGAEWRRIDAQIGAILDQLGLAVFDDPDNLAKDEIHLQDAIENQIAALVPRSAAGAVVQLRLLREHMQMAEWGDREERLVGNLIAGLDELGTEAVAMMATPFGRHGGGRGDHGGPTFDRQGQKDS